MGIFDSNDQYDIHVSTQPMADKIDVVSNKVDMTTGAVAAMETAVIAQEKSSTEQICGKLDVGFFNVVISQIAQKLANENAKTRALAIELMQQQKALQSLQSRMTGDYNMIGSRYAKLFGSLNQELRNRISELDKPLMDYCSQQVKQLQNRIYGLVSGVPVLQSESLTATQAIAAAHIKRNAQNLISAAGEYIKHDKQQERTTQNLWNSKIDDEEIYYVPMIIDEENTELRSGASMIKDNQALKTALGDVAYQKTVQTLDSVVKSIDWKTDDSQSANIANQYAEMVEKADIPKRLKDVMMKMFDGKFQTL
jgi:hypothetical protein